MTNKKESVYSDEITDRPCPAGPQGATGPSEPPAPSCSSGVTCFDGVPIEYTPEQLAAFAEYSDDWENYWDND
jgi:hypothetical protein